MSRRPNFVDDPGISVSGVLFPLLFMITVIATGNYFNAHPYQLLGVVLGYIAISIVVGYLVQKAVDRRRNPPQYVRGPYPQGVDELQAIRAAGPMQCRYCNASLLPSSALCPKCGRRNF